MADEMTETLKQIDTKLGALLAIVVDGHLRDTEIAKPRPRSIDRMLTDTGLSQVEVARLLGKSPQAVGQVLAKDGKHAKKAGEKAAKKAASTPAGSDPV